MTKHHVLILRKWFTPSTLDALWGTWGTQVRAKRSEKYFKKSQKIKEILPQKRVANFLAKNKEATRKSPATKEETVAYHASK